MPIIRLKMLFRDLALMQVWLQFNSIIKVIASFARDLLVQHYLFASRGHDIMTDVTCNMHMTMCQVRVQFAGNEIFSMNLVIRNKFE